MTTGLVKGLGAADKAKGRRRKAENLREMRGGRNFMEGLNFD